MSFSALVVQVLISSPSDLPPEHHDIVLRSLRVWNVTHGRIYGIHFSPTDWKEGGSPAFGKYPQDVLNEQIVDDSDVGIVVFTDRLGSRTPDHPSGTAEEIDRLLSRAKDVAILQNDCSRAPSRGGNAADQKQALEQYLASIKERAFVGGYDSNERLREVMDSLLTRLANKHRREADAALIDDSTIVKSGFGEALTEESTDMSGGVWPRVELTDSPETDSRGRLKVKKRWFLMLESTFAFPVHKVRFHYEDAGGQRLESFDLMGDRHEVIEIMAPHGSSRFPILQSMGSPSVATCVVTWEGQDGKERSTRASVRTH